MLAEAQDRVETNGWRNVSLVQSDAAAFEFPSEVDAILSTYALTQVTGCADVIAHGAAALRPGGRWTVLDLKLPDYAPAAAWRGSASRLDVDRAPAVGGDSRRDGGRAGRSSPGRELLLRDCVPR